MKIEFMSSVDILEHCKYFNVISYKLYLRRHVNKNIHPFIISETEIWTLDGNDDTINIKIAEPNLNNYVDYPELFIVDSDFCTKK